jgi:hypothetical protein
MAKNTKISKIKETEETVSGTTDLTSDVTGVLPVGNGGTGLTSISTLLNSNVTTISGNAGTATKLATQRDLQVDLSDSGAGGFDGSGNTLDIGVGSSVLGVTNGGTGLTSISTLLNSNTTKSDVGLGNVENKSSATIRGEIVAGDIPTLNQDTTGTATNATKQIVVTTHNFQLANTTGTFFYVPFNNLNESSAGGTSNYWTRTVPPYAGTIKKIAVRSHTSLGTSCELRISKITDTTDALTGGTHVDNTSIDISSANVSVIETMNTNSFAAGDAVGVALKRSAGTAARVVMTIAWEYTT